MAKIYVDGKPYDVPDGMNLLEACLSVGINLPYFCWHPAMGSVGACRQCAVKQFKDEKDTKGKIVMACMTPAHDGTRIAIDDPEVKEAHKSLIEWLMLNHPHDCPVCDEGGECHLQDMTVLTGHDYRRSSFKKRTYCNQELGPFLTHDMNRCIQCYRCVRFYQDYAGGRDFAVLGIHDRVYFGRYKDGIMESEFSGNLVEVCPTGVFDDKTLDRHYTRKWDLQTAPSICVHCGLGCNTIPGERYGMLRRIRNRYNYEVNDYFLCDRGRYGYEFVNSERRIRRPLLRAGKQGPVKVTTKENALRHMAALLGNGERVIGIGSPRASVEANFALRALVGPRHFYMGVSRHEAELLAAALQMMRQGPARSPSQRDARMADAVLVLGEDVPNTAPMLALQLRQSVHQAPLKRAIKLHISAWDDYAVREVIQHDVGPLIIATPITTRLQDVASGGCCTAPDDLARLGFALAHALSSQAPEVPDLSLEERSRVAEFAGELRGAERPLVLSGISSGSLAVMQAAANVAWALCREGRPAQLGFVVPQCNSLGLQLIGGNDLDAALQAMAAGQVDTAIILENDLYRRADPGVVGEALRRTAHVVVLDHLANDTTAQAEVAFPAATFAEEDGTLVNSEGRAQRFYQVFVPEGEIAESWRWLRDIMAESGHPEAREWAIIDDIQAEIARALPALAGILGAAPPATFRIAGEKIARQPHRWTGRTAMYANVTVFEPPPPPDPDTPLDFSMEGYQGEPPPALIPRFWAPNWNSVQAVNKYQQEVAGVLRGGTPGKRLIEPDEKAGPPYFEQIPARFQPRPGEWLVVPLYHVFGSDELSILTPGIAERAPEPYLALDTDDLASLGLQDGEQVRLSTGEASYILPIRQAPSLPRGVAGLAVGLPGSPRVALPAWGQVAREVKP